MNNLQHLYNHNKEFRSYITSHLCIFEKWYPDELKGTTIDDDIEADRWLMAEHAGEASSETALLEQARNDLETLKLYTAKVRDLLVNVYGYAVWLLDGVPDDKKTAGDLEEMNGFYRDIKALGIEV